MIKACKCFLVIGFVSIVNVCYAQLRNPEQIDSLIKAADKIDNVDKSISLGIKAVSYARKMNYEKGIILGLTLAAAKSYNSGRYGDVLKYVEQADNAVSVIKDPSLKVHLIILKGMSLTNLGFYQQAKALLNSGLAVASTISNPNRRHYRLSYIYSALADNNDQNKGRLQITLQLSRKSYDEQMQISDTSSSANGKALVTNNLADCYLKINKNDSAEYYLKSSVSLAAKFKDVTVCAFANTDLGDLYFKEKRYNDAKLAYHKAVLAAKEMENAYQLKLVYQGLSRVYAALKNIPKSDEYLQLTMRLTDSLNEVEKAAIQTPLNTIIKKKDTEISSSTQKYSDLEIILVIISALLILILGAFLIFSGRFKKRLKISDERIAELSKNIATEKPQYTVSQLKDIVELAVNYNPLFMTKFNEVYPDFTEKLLVLAPCLIASEMEICIFLRINFDTKEIARYTKSSIRSIEGKKRRIRKKLNIDSKIDLNLWMASV